MNATDLLNVIALLRDEDFIDITRPGFCEIGSRVTVLPGVRGRVVRHDADGDSVVQVKVGPVRRVMRHCVS
jgi:hypothetical protein